MGVGTANGWTGSSLALDAMTMGLYFNQNVGAEVGMGMLANGTYQDHRARINNFHSAVKGKLQLAELFSIYGKLGVGASLGQGHVTKPMVMPIMTTNVGPFYGAGILFKLTKHVSLYVEDSGIVVVASGQQFGSVNQGTVGLEFHM